MDGSDYPATHIPAPYDPAGYRLMGHDAGRAFFDKLSKKLESMNSEDIATDESANELLTYTIRQAAAKTGLPRNVIYRMIQKGDIEARMAPGGPDLWLIPANVVHRLMAEKPGNSGPDAESGADVISNNMM